MFRSLPLPLVLAVLFCLQSWLQPSGAHGATVLIDFGPTANVMTGKGPTIGQPQTWNNFTVFSSASSLALVDTLGASTGYTVATSGGFVAALDEGANPVGAPYPNTAAGDAFYTTVARTVSFSGLSTALTYNITVYGYASRTDSRMTRVTINGNAQLYEPSNTNSGNVDGGFVTFSGLVPNSSGIINLDFTTATSTNYILSVIELTSVPEPTYSLLFTMGLATLALHRKRRVR